MAAQDSDTNREIQHLLRAGLRLYSLGDVERANDQWNQVLSHVEDHDTATDYLTNSLVSLEGTDAAEAMNASPAVLDEHADEIDEITNVHNLVVELIKQSKLEQALVLLEHGRSQFEKGDHRFSRVSKLVRNLLTLRYVVALGPLHQLVDAAEHAEADDLSAEEMHILALVDVSASQEGLTIDDLLSDSLYGPFKTLRALVTLRNHEYVRLRSPDAPTPDPDDLTVTASGEAAPDDSAEPDDAAEEATSAEEQDPPADAEAPSDAEETPDAEDPADETDVEETDVEETDVVTSTGDTDPGTDTAPSLDDDFDDVFRRAVGAYVNGEFAEARSLFEECAEMRPDDPRPTRNLERIEALGK